MTPQQLNQAEMQLNNMAGQIKQNIRQYQMLSEERRNAKDVDVGNLFS